LLILILFFSKSAIQTPDLFNDMIKTKSKLSYITICVTIGYFIYDAIDIIYTNYRKMKAQNYEVLIHHILVSVLISLFFFSNEKRKEKKTNIIFHFLKIKF
jgi:hypothetical protein